MELKVHVEEYPTSAYVCIEQMDGPSLDIRIPAGKPASVALTESARYLRQQAQRLTTRAALCEVASHLV